jgi:hypothetical protein
MALFVVNSIIMKLVMYIGNDMIQSMPIDYGMITQPGYLGNIVRQLKIENSSRIIGCALEPEFFIFFVQNRFAHNQLALFAA